MGKKTSSAPTQTTNAPPAYIQNAQQQVLGAAGQLMGHPLNQYSGPLQAGWTPAQNTAFNTINSAQGVYAPYLNSGAQYTANAANSIPGVSAQQTVGDISQFMNPYLNTSIQNTLNYMNNQNQQQQNQLTGNAVSAGAYGGDRAAVAAGVLGGQQALAMDQTIAQMENQGYQQAAQQALQQQQLGLQAGSEGGLLNLYAGQQMAGLGSQAQANALQGANAQLGIGNEQQAFNQQQLNIPYQQYEATQQYPYQQLSYYANLLNAMTPGAGGTTYQTSPTGSVFGDLLGGLSTGAGLAGMFGGSGNLGYSSDLSGYTPYGLTQPIDVSGSLYNTVPTIASGGAVSKASPNISVTDLTGPNLGNRFSPGVPQLAFQNSGPLDTASVSNFTPPNPNSAPFNSTPSMFGGQFPSSGLGTASNWPVGPTDMVPSTSGSNNNAGGIASAVGMAIPFLVAMLGEGGRVPHRDMGGMLPTASVDPLVDETQIPNLNFVRSGLDAPHQSGSGGGGSSGSGAGSLLQTAAQLAPLIASFFRTGGGVPNYDMGGMVMNHLGMAGMRPPMMHGDPGGMPMRGPPNTTMPIPGGMNGMRYDSGGSVEPTANPFSTQALGTVAGSRQALTDELPSLMGIQVPLPHLADGGTDQTGYGMVDQGGMLGGLPTGVSIGTPIPTAAVSASRLGAPRGGYYGMGNQPGLGAVNMGNIVGALPTNNLDNAAYAMGNLDKFASDPNLALIAGGLSMMGSRGNLAQAISQGGFSALQALAQQREAKAAAQKEAAEESYRQGSLGIEAQRLDAEMKKFQMEQDLKTQELQQTGKHQTATEEIERQRNANEAGFQQGELKYRGAEASARQAEIYGTPVAYVPTSPDGLQGHPVYRNPKGGTITDSSMVVDIPSRFMPRISGAASANPNVYKDIKDARAASDRDFTYEQAHGLTQATSAQDYWNSNQANYPLRSANTPSAPAGGNAPPVPSSKFGNPVATDKSGKAVYKNGNQYVYGDGTPYKP